MNGRMGLLPGELYYVGVALPLFVFLYEGQLAK